MYRQRIHVGYSNIVVTNAIGHVGKTEKGRGGQQDMKAGPGKTGCHTKVSKMSYRSRRPKPDLSPLALPHPPPSIPSSRLSLSGRPLRLCKQAGVVYFNAVLVPSLWSGW